jgi:hypothetical protein
MKIKLNRRELASVLAGLRMVQHAVATGNPLPRGIKRVFSDDHSMMPLHSDEIDELCERLNK